MPPKGLHQRGPHASEAVVHRTVQVGSVTISVVEVDICLAQVDAIVNAANSLSFMPMDGGVSGALRNACKPDVVVGAEKLWWDDNGDEHRGTKLPTTQAGVQPAAGGLLARGVQHVVHAVGPIWSDYPIKDTTFSVVLPRIRRTVKRALSAAERTGARSCAMPAISGGIFTHWRPGSDIKEREQRAARLAVVQAVLTWSREHSGSTLESVQLCDLGSRSKGSIQVFVAAFDEVLRQHAQSAESGDAAEQEPGDDAELLPTEGDTVVETGVAQPSDDASEPCG